MRSTPAVASIGAGLLSAALLGASQSPPSPTPSPRPSPTASPRTIAETVEVVVERIEKERADPCFRARQEGRPCFPVTTTRKGPDASVREEFLRPDAQPGKPTPGAPTRDDLGPYRPTGRPASAPLAQVTIDPGCVGRSLLKGLRGKNDTYHVYVVRDHRGERVAMYDHRLEAKTFQGDLEYVGRFDGECEAIAAVKAEEKRLLARRAPASPSPYPSPP